MQAFDLPAGEGMVARIRVTDRHDGDFRIDGPQAPDETRSVIHPGPWVWLRQVHGADVVEVERAGQWAGAAADAAVCRSTDTPIGVQTADCTPIVLVAPGCAAVIHAGWRGVVAGIIGATLESVRGAGSVVALIGPCIRPEHYEFGEEDLERVAAVAGPSARSRTAAGRPALDLAAAVTSLLVCGGVETITDTGLDTSRSRFFSHRVRSDEGRQLTAVWLEPR